jgi:hypothetical protein
MSRRIDLTEYDAAAVHYFGAFAKTNFNWSLVAA